MARLYIFDDKRSIWHAVFGFITAFTLSYSLIILFMYIIYQVKERENPIATLGDVVEFLIGYVYGLAIVVWWIYFEIRGGG